jgi:large subunit ribosomal protein L15
MPKRGFNNKRFRVDYNIVNVEQLNGFSGEDVVNQETLLKAGVLSRPRAGLRILGTGELKVKLTVEANGFTKSAREKIESLDGTCKVLS